MRDRFFALRIPAFASLLLGAAAIVSAQGTLDLRLPPERRSPAEASCRLCGEIRSIREVQTEAPVPMAPNPARTTASNPNNWAVVGAVVYMPTGPSTNNAFQMGAVGTPEMVERFGSSTYEITIRMDSGENQSVRRRDGALFRVGDRVVVSEGRLEKR